MFDFAHYQIFNDGNKRTGLATMGIFLEANGYEFVMDDKDAYQFTMDIANNRYEEIPDIANIIKENTIFADVDKSIFLNESIIYKENDNTLENEDECYDRD